MACQGTRYLVTGNKLDPNNLEHIRITCSVSWLLKVYCTELTKYDEASKLWKSGTGGQEEILTKSKNKTTKIMTNSS